MCSSGHSVVLCLLRGPLRLGTGRILCVACSLASRAASSLRCCCAPLVLFFSLPLPSPSVGARFGCRFVCATRLDSLSLVGVPALSCVDGYSGVRQCANVLTLCTMGVSSTDLGR
jgi:hypothetical protein